MPTRPAPLTLPDHHATSALHPSDTTPLATINSLAMALPLTVPGAVLDGHAGDGAVDLIDLRLRLLRRQTPPAVRDAAWRHIAGRARTERGDWNLFALGMAYPGLIEQARRLARLYSTPTSWMHFRIATEFLFAMHNPRVVLDHPYLLRRLLGTPYDQASGRKRRPDPATVPIDTLADSDVDADQHHPPGNPGLVLDRLVKQTRHAGAARRLTSVQAELIAGTYLDGDTLTVVAARLGLGQSHASKQRARAAALVATLLGHPELAATPPTEQ